MRICVIFNPAAKGEKAKRFRKELAKFAGQCAVKMTQSPGAGRTLAAAAVQEGFDTIVAAGGDGTINEVLNGIGDHPAGFQDVRLGILPVGTVNVFAREMGLPHRVLAAWETIIRGREKSIDLPQFQFKDGGECRNRYFIQMAGAGWDARAIETVDPNLKKKIGQFAYMFAGLRALREKRPSVTVISGPKTFRGELVIIGNGRFYGGEIPVFHRADNCDGLLDVCVFPKITRRVLLRYALAYLSPRFFKPREEAYFQAASIRLESEPPAPVQMDGETVGTLPAECTIRRHAVRVIAS